MSPQYFMVTYVPQLHGKTANCGWNIKQLTPFRQGSCDLRHLPTTHMVVISFVYYSLIFGEFSENTSLPLNNPHGLTMVQSNNSGSVCSNILSMVPMSLIMPLSNTGLMNQSTSQLLFGPGWVHHAVIVTNLFMPHLSYQRPTKKFQLFLCLEDIAVSGQFCAEVITQCLTIHKMLL